MFSGLDTVDVQHGRRWTALTSFTLQGILVSAAIILPLLNPAILPDLRHRTFVPISLGDPHMKPSQSVMQQGGAIHPQALFVRRGISYSPAHNQPATTDVPSPPNLPPGIGPVGVHDGFSSLLPGDYVQPVLRPLPAAKPRPTSVVMEGNLIHRVEPQYPAIAKQTRLQGVVVLRAVISSGGAIDHVQVVSGPAILAHAAIEAVNQWRYRPYYLNGLAIPVETQITVNFTLNQ